MDNELQPYFDKMVSGKAVRMNPEYRKTYPNPDCLGTWWYIHSVNSDNTIDICSNTHSYTRNAPLESIILTTSK